MLDEVVHRFEASDVPVLRDAAELALCRRAQHELSKGRASTAIRLLNRVMLQGPAGSPGGRLQGHLIRARAHLLKGYGKACAVDIERALSILPERKVLPREVLLILANLASDVGLEMMRNLIKSSPAADVLLPLSTALELELGLEPRVTREVKEIAEDVRRELLAGAKSAFRGQAT